MIELSRLREVGSGQRQSPLLYFLYLHKIKLHRGISAKNADKHSELPLIGLHFVDRAVKVGKRPVDDLDRITLLELHARPRPLSSAFHLPEEILDFLFPERRGISGVTDKPGNFRS